MNLFHLDASLRNVGSVSRELGRTFREAWQDANPDGTVTYRDIAANPVPHLSGEQLAAAWAPAAERSSAQLEALSLSGQFVDELLGADAYLFTVPLYNWGVPSSFKAWVDHVMIGQRLAGQNPALSGRSAVVFMAKGGAYGPGTPKEGWDHAEPWLRHVLADALGLDLEVISAELTLAGVNPALSHLTGLADASLASARRAAVTSAEKLSVKLAA
jgi:FMN-dependent NADH-azoreductase